MILGKLGVVAEALQSPHCLDTGVLIDKKSCSATGVHSRVNYSRGRLILNVPLSSVTLLRTLDH